MVRRSENGCFCFRNAKVVGSTPIIGTHTTKSIKNNNLKSISLSSYDLLLRDSMTNSCRYG
ncbi:hypothetical protein DDJ66_21745 [Klebsiella oxytoca]|nr:hypothetical protein DDJ34_20540 [Klebsiella oxytoca]RFP46438.1 hypothetical protein DDJ66_21745 [Klebsiella oxytoca]RFP48996.1 hypothetical protein DDJ69_20700 [Klebsiella oxytoca]